MLLLALDTVAAVEELAFVEELPRFGDCLAHVEETAPLDAVP